MSSIDDLLKKGVNHYSHYRPEKPVAAEEEQGDFSRGIEKAGRQIPQTFGGLAAFAGDVIGSEGMKQYGLDIYNRQSEEIQKITKPSDSFTSVMEGDGNFVDFLQGGAGYVAGQLGTAVLTGGVGGFIGSQLVKRGLGAVAGSAAAKMGAKAGAVTGLAGLNLMQSAGSIYPEALEQAQTDGRNGVLSGSDLARVGVSAVGSAAVDTGMDMLMAGRLLKGARKEGEGIVRAAAREIPGGMAKEAVTEGIQTGIERFGAQKELGSAEAMRDYVDSSALGALGGGMGGAAAILRAQKQPDTGPLSRAANEALEARAQEEEAKILLLDNKSGGLVNYKFPDGTVGDEAAVNAYIGSIPDEQEREKVRREIMRLDPESGERIVTNAESAAAIKTQSAKFAPMQYEQAEAILAAPNMKGKDYMIVPHASGTGFALIPHRFVSTDMQGQAISAAREWKAAQKERDKAGDGAKSEQTKRQWEGEEASQMPEMPAVLRPTSPANPRIPVPTEPAGSFGAVDELGSFIEQEKADLASRRVQMAQQNAAMIEQDRVQRESALESVAGRVDQENVRRNMNERAAILDAVLADTTVSNPGGKFAADLKRAGYPRDAIHPDEQARIDRHAELVQTFANDTIPSAPNEMPVESLIKEKKPKVTPAKPKELPNAKFNAPTGLPNTGSDGSGDRGRIDDTGGMGSDGVGSVGAGPAAGPVPENGPGAAGPRNGVDAVAAQPGLNPNNPINPDNPVILTPSGKPFMSEFAAKRRIKADGLTDTHEVASTDDGWVVQPKATAAPVSEQVEYANELHERFDRWKQEEAETSPSELKARAKWWKQTIPITARRTATTDTEAVEKITALAKKAGIAPESLEFGIWTVPEVRADQQAQVDRGESTDKDTGDDAPFTPTVEELREGAALVMQSPYYKRGMAYMTPVGVREDGTLDSLLINKKTGRPSKTSTHNNEYVLRNGKLIETEPNWGGEGGSSRAGYEVELLDTLPGFASTSTKADQASEPKPAPAEVAPAPILAKKVDKPKADKRKATIDRIAAKDPFRAFLLKHGISLKDKSDTGADTGKRGNPFTPGVGTIYRNDGQRLDILATLALEAGFLTDADIENASDNGGANKLADMIQRAVHNKEVILPAGQADQKFEDDADARELQAMYEDAQARGIDTAGLSDEQLRDTMRAVYADDVGAATADEYDAIEAVADDIGDGLTAADINALARIATNEEAISNEDLTAQSATDSVRQVAETDARDARESDSGTQAPPSDQGQAGEEGFDLAAETADQARTRIAADEKAAKAKEKADAAAAAAERDERIKKEIAARQDASADNFQLGQSAEEGLSGQTDIFSQPEPTTPAKPEPTAPASNEDTGADIPKAFWKKVTVDHDVWLTDEKRYESVPVSADKAMASVREDLNHLRSLLACMKG